MSRGFRELLCEMLEWEKLSPVYQSTQHVGGKHFTQSATNWRKITPSTEPGRLEKIYKAWEGDHDWSGFTSWDRMAKATGLSVEQIASEVKAYQKKNPEGVGFSVDRMGAGTYFKFKGKLELEQNGHATTPSPAATYREDREDKGE